MAETNEQEGAIGAPATEISQGQTTSVADGAQTMQFQPEQEVPAERPPSIWDNWLLYAVAALWLWYLFGNKKRKAAKAAEKQERERRAGLVKGDNIITIGRMHGQVVAFTDSTVTIKPDPKADYTLTFERQAVLRVLPRPGEENEAAVEGGR
ncbi:MAG: preprotein translocase subunit YajC [Planctomycetes bacterium]|nr:preprotein translocase subunit YajC [Planctomycetota bacterium]